MTEVTGIKELKELIKFVIELGEAVELGLEDKKFEIAELALLMGPLMQIGTAFEGMDKLGGELKDLSEAESLELVSFVKDELDLKADNTEEIIEAALELGVKIYGFVKMFKKEEVVVAEA